MVYSQIDLIIISNKDIYFFGLYPISGKTHLKYFRLYEIIYIYMFFLCPTILPSWLVLYLHCCFWTFLFCYKPTGMVPIPQYTVQYLMVKLYIYLSFIPLYHHCMLYIPRFLRISWFNPQHACPLFGDIIHAPIRQEPPSPELQGACGEVVPESQFRGCQV